MTSLFPKCKTIQWAFLALGMAGGVAAFLLLDSSSPTRAIVAVLALITGYMVGRLQALRYALTTHEGILNILNKDYDPARFIEAYEPLPGRCAEGSIERAVALNHLACGYAATGDFARAIDTLENTVDTLSTPQVVSSRMLTANNLCRFYLATGNISEAERLIGELRELAQDLSSRQPGMSQNLRQSLRLYEEQLDFLKGGAPDLGYMREEAEVGKGVHRVDVQLLLAQMLIKAGQTEEARECLEAMTEQYPELHAGRQAAQILSELPA